MPFDGKTYDRELDGARLKASLRATFDYMRPGQWVSIAEVAAKIGCSETGASTRIRDLRKAKFGGFTVDARRVGSGREGIWQYRLIVVGRGQLPLL